MIAILGLTDEGQLLDDSFTGLFEVSPALAGDVQCFRGRFHGIDLGDSEMGHVRPLFVEVKRADIENVVQFAETVRREGYPDEHRRRFGHEVLDVAEGDVERLHILANAFHERDSIRFGTVELAWRQDSDVRRKVSVRWMNFCAEVFDKFADRVSDVRYQGVLAGFCHEGLIIRVSVRYNREVGA